MSIHPAPGHDHDQDDGGQGVQAAAAAESAAAAELRMFTLPVRGAGQDLSGGYQAADITITLSQPAGGAPLQGSAVQQLLGRDYDRIEACVLAISEPVMLAPSREAAEQAYAAGQGSATPIAGAFSWLPAGVDRVRRNCDELWAALPGAAASAALVSVMVSRRLPVDPPPRS